MQIGVGAQRAVENRRVFVIDEDDISRAALQFMLADDNETHEFATCEAALARGEFCRPDLVLLGSDYAARRAGAFIERLRAAWPAAKVLMIRAPGETAASASALPAGIDDTIDRPFKLEAVRRKADRWLGRKVELRIAVLAR
jgi:DNA-binding response OmpR family regulator